jgi:hypothetical protein
VGAFVLGDIVGAFVFGAFVGDEVGAFVVGDVVGASVGGKHLVQKGPLGSVSKEGSTSDSSQSVALNISLRMAVSFILSPQAQRLSVKAL